MHARSNASYMKLNKKHTDCNLAHQHHESCCLCHCYLLLYHHAMSLLPIHATTACMLIKVLQLLC
jgi:hypothetical protein